MKYSILAREIDSATNRPFVWGECDCCLFAAGVVKAMTGKDYASEFRGKYKSARGALGALKRYGKGDLEKTMDSKLPRTSSPGRGDVVMTIVNGMQALGICVGRACAFKSPDGLSFIDTSDITAAWAVT